ncbi:hypothetical protein V6N13_020409 [Hibiscus sabdariffa]|uniref:Nucleoside-diphosphate kinase n=1 Tax=Hibiscus sabdariffa TaxID=183260 RepID=A0ABR2ETE0_9ROSI
MTNILQECASIRSGVDATCNTNHGSASVDGFVDTTLNFVDDVICSPEPVRNDDAEDISVDDTSEKSQRGLQPADSVRNCYEEVIPAGKRWLYLSGNKQF